MKQEHYLDPMVNEDSQPCDYVYEQQPPRQRIKPMAYFRGDCTGQVFYISRSEKNNFNGDLKQIKRVERMRSQNECQKRRWRQQRDIQEAAMRELVEKGELDSSQAQHLLNTTQEGL